jgi:hypothetical protein
MFQTNYCLPPHEIDKSFSRHPAGGTRLLSAGRGTTHIIISVKNEEEEEVEEASVLYYQSIVVCLGGGGTLRIKLLVYKYSSRQPNKRERHFLCAIFFKQRKNKSRRRTSV